MLFEYWEVDSVVEEKKDQNRELEGLWSPLEIAEAIGIHRQSVFHAIAGKGSYPIRLPVVRYGNLVFVRDEDAKRFIHWKRTGEFREVQASEVQISEEKIYWTTEEIALAAGVSRSYVIKLVGGREGRSGAVPGIKAQGRAWLVKNSDALSFIEQATKRKIH